MSMVGGKEGAKNEQVDIAVQFLFNGSSLSVISAVYAVSSYSILFWHRLAALQCQFVCCLMPFHAV